MPQTEEEFKEEILDVEEFWQFPCCWTTIDGCPMVMKYPPGGHAKSAIILRISTLLS